MATHVELPTGTVTFLFTDVEGSTRLWEEHPDAMRAALARHDELIAAAIDSHGGRVVKTTGDGFHAVFASAWDAIAAAAAAQRAIESEPWSDPAQVRARMGVHTGEAHQRAGDYYGSSTNRAARLMSAGHGGQIVVSGVTAALVSEHLPTEFELLSLGEHRLRDLAEPVAVFQLAAPGLPRDFPRLRSLDAYPSNLPAQLSSFVGRERDVLEIAKLLREKRLVTLTGVGGVGKTRLALQVAAEVLPRFPDGAWLCELAPVRDPAGVVDAVANVFQVTARPGMSLQESLAAYLRDQEVLVVLDNCEHLLRPVAALVTAIEGECPGARVLATSREGLSVRGEQMLGVASLDVPDDTNSIEALSGYEAVRLFVDRASSVKANFALDATTADGVAQVCRRLDGVPLAIELAAARVGAMNPAELARRLDRRFRLLTGGDRVAIERHQTLRATIDWSYDLLTEPEQRLLDRMSVFVGGCTLDAVEAVCEGAPIDGDDVFDLLANLVARSLVVADDTGLDTRYRLLETIRQYGEERLAEAGEVDALRARHCDYYIEFARATCVHLYGPEQIEWGGRLAREHDNLLVAMAFALATRDLERAMALLREVAFFGQVNDIVSFDPDPVLALSGAPDHPGSSVAFMLAAFQAQRRGDGPHALELCERALVAEQRQNSIPNPQLTEESFVLRAYVAQDRGAFDEAVRNYHEGARHARASGLLARAAVSLGAAQGLLSWVDPVAALARGTEGLEVARESGQPYAIAFTQLALAQALMSDDRAQASVVLEAALAQTARLDYEQPIQLITTLFTAARLGRWSVALRAGSRALDQQLRSGTLPVLFLAGGLNVIARGLAEARPDPAAVLQGAVGALMRQLVILDAPNPDRAPTTTGSRFGPFIAETRRETTRILAAALGDDRLHELRAQGAAMDEDSIYVFARRQIDEYLATIDQDA